jgi:hypothetical protein
MISVLGEFFKILISHLVPLTKFRDLNNRYEPEKTSQ